MFKLTNRIWQRQNTLAHCHYFSSKKLLKPFYMVVHPDLFQKHPIEQKVNEESLKTIHSYLDEDLKKTYDVTLTFHLKHSNKDSISQVQVHLTHDVSRDKMINNILKTCGLPSNTTTALYENLQNEVKIKYDNYQKDNDLDVDTYVNYVGDLRFGKFSQHTQLTLTEWLKENNERISVSSQNKIPLKEKYSSLVKQFQLKYQLKNIYTSSSTYSYSTLNSALKQLKELLDRDFSCSACKLLKDRIIKFDSFNGLDQFGRVVLNIHDIPRNWKLAILSLPTLLPSLPLINTCESQLSKEYFNINIIKSRAATSYPAQYYLAGLQSMLGRLKKDTFVTDRSFKGLNAFFSWDDDFLGVSIEGYILLHPYTHKKALYQFCSKKYDDIKAKRVTYLHDLGMEKKELENCVEYFNLESLERDRSLKHHQVLTAFDSLKSSNDRSLLNSFAIIISNYYSVSVDGLVRIPWDHQLG